MQGPGLPSSMLCGKEEAERKGWPLPAWRFPLGLPRRRWRGGSRKPCSVPTSSTGFQALWSHSPTPTPAKPWERHLTIERQACFGAFRAAVPGVVALPFTSLLFYDKHYKVGLTMESSHNPFEGSIMKGPH